jgi:hypothetical protein
MLISRVIDKVKSVFFPSADTALSEFISANPNTFGYWLRPSNDLQSQQMVGAYLQGVKDDLKNGGYIFVKKSRAAELFRQLAELGAAYTAVHFKVMEDVAEIIDLDKPKALWVIVEDDSLPYETQASRFRVAEKALREKMVKALGIPIYHKHVNAILESRQSRCVINIVFIEMDFPSMRGFTVVQTHCRSLNIKFCRVSRDNAHDHEVNKIFSEPEHDNDEWKSRIVNSMMIFGSGPRHQPELMMCLHDILEYGITYEDSDEARSPFKQRFISVERLKEESKLGLAVGFGSAHMVDMSR